MLKKSLFVVALVAMMVPATFGRDYLHNDGSWNSTPTTVGDPAGVSWEYDGSTSERKAESYNWPATYDYQDVCVIPVRMDVGFWIKVIGCKDCALNLKQVEIHKYAGSVDVGIQCNVNIQLTASWSKASGMPTMNQDSLTVSPSTLDAPGGTVTITLKLKDVDLSGLAGGQNSLQVGTVTLRVRPNVKPVLAGGIG